MQNADQAIGETKTTFDNALSRFATVLVGGDEVAALATSRFLRDIHGRLSLLAKADSGPLIEKLRAHLRAEESGSAPFVLAPFVTSIDEAIIVLEADDPLFQETPRIESISLDLGTAGRRAVEVEVLDRRVAGEDWLTEIRVEATAKRPQRVIFFSMKGGVGRSTALAVLAADLAEKGRNVLAIDFDLEAPGLGSTLLADGGTPRFGVVDWLAQIAAGDDGGALLDDMVGASTFTSGRSVVDIVPAFGQSSVDSPDGYLAKLARAYTPGAAAGSFLGKSYAEKCRSLVDQLERRRAYDVTLVDSRAGMHETGASSLMALGGAVLFFGADVTHTFDDYRFLFAALKGPFRRLVARDRAAADAFRDNLQMISAKTMSAEMEALYRFREASFDLFSEYVYDEEQSGADFDSFRFSRDDPDAPHWAWPIQLDPAMLTFDPRRDPKVLDRYVYERAFGTFLDNVHQKLLGDDASPG